MKIFRILLPALLLLPVLLAAQSKLSKANQNEIYIDQKGILRLQSNGAEASYFGVNYTLPFAYGYRSHQRLQIDIEKAIDQDVYHLARLGINAFRVHVWDTEISDSTGNLLNNEHLRLFDYLLAKLEARNIRIIITPIAFWGNGYPDQDDKTGSWSEKYTKAGAVIKEEAFKAQERYLSQFFKHVNPYTRKTYGQDRFVIATEVNNEPHHSGAKSLTTSYVNRMKAAIKSTGWTKPVFYNISESPDYADAVAKSTADGFSFQWYPTGLVAGHELKGNLLPNVDQYVIPFDTIPAFHHKPRMIYEFDAADVLKSYMYPAMARSFKKAGFQWATQFAYDPMGTAYANTEYQTHYLNLAYTPSKAISLLIAGKAFRQIPLYKSYGTFPADTTFGPFTVSYKRQLSEMNAAKEFYYSNSTRSLPLNQQALQHIAGVGSSPLVSYQGTGAYFIDQLANGSWRLEVLPDVITLGDPFGKNTLNRAFTQVLSRNNQMTVLLKDLGADFKVLPLNEGNIYAAAAEQGKFAIEPGTYLLLKKGNSNTFQPDTRIGEISLNEFVDPTVLLKKNPLMGMATESVTARRKRDTIAFAGRLTDHKPAVQHSTSVALYNANLDRDQIVIYSPDWKTDPYAYVNRVGADTVLQLKHLPSAKALLGGIEVFVKDQISAQAIPLAHSYKSIRVAAASTVATPIKIVLFSVDGLAFSANALVGKDYQNIDIPLSAFKRDAAVLLPRPYPGFQALTFSAAQPGKLLLKDIEKVQLLLNGNATKEFSFEIGRISLEK